MYRQLTKSDVETNGRFLAYRGTIGSLRTLVTADERTRVWHWQEAMEEEQMHVHGALRHGWTPVRGAESWYGTEFGSRR